MKKIISFFLITLFFTISLFAEDQKQQINCGENTLLIEKSYRDSNQIKIEEGSLLLLSSGESVEIPLVNVPLSNEENPNFLEDIRIELSTSVSLVDQATGWTVLIEELLLHQNQVFIKRGFLNIMENLFPIESIELNTHGLKLTHESKIYADIDNSGYHFTGSALISAGTNGDSLIKFDEVEISDIYVFDDNPIKITFHNLVFKVQNSGAFSVKESGYSEKTTLSYRNHRIEMTKADLRPDGLFLSFQMNWMAEESLGYLKFAPFPVNHGEAVSFGWLISESYIDLGEWLFLPSEVEFYPDGSLGFKGFFPLNRLISSQNIEVNNLRLTNTFSFLSLETGITSEHKTIRGLNSINAIADQWEFNGNDLQFSGQIELPSTIAGEDPVSACFTLKPNGIILIEDDNLEFSYRYSGCNYWGQGLSLSMDSLTVGQGFFKGTTSISINGEDEGENTQLQDVEFSIPFKNQIFSTSGTIIDLGEFTYSDSISLGQFELTPTEIKIEDGITIVGGKYMFPEYLGGDTVAIPGICFMSDRETLSQDVFRSFSDLKAINHYSFDIHGFDIETSRMYIGDIGIFLSDMKWIFPEELGIPSIETNNLTLAYNGEMDVYEFYPIDIHGFEMNFDNVENRDGNCWVFSGEGRLPYYFEGEDLGNGFGGNSFVIEEFCYYPDAIGFSEAIDLTARIDRRIRLELNDDQIFIEVDTSTITEENNSLVFKGLGGKIDLDYPYHNRSAQVYFDRGDLPLTGITINFNEGYYEFDKIEGVTQKVYTGDIETAITGIQIDRECGMSIEGQSRIDDDKEIPEFLKDLEFDVIEYRFDYQRNMEAFNLHAVSNPEEAPALLFNNQLIMEGLECVASFECGAEDPCVLINILPKKIQLGDNFPEGLKGLIIENPQGSLLYDLDNEVFREVSLEFSYVNQESDNQLLVNWEGENKYLQEPLVRIFLEDDILHISLETPTETFLF